MCHAVCGSQTMIGTNVNPEFKNQLVKVHPIGGFWKSSPLFYQSNQYIRWNETPCDTLIVALT